MINDIKGTIGTSPPITVKGHKLPGRTVSVSVVYPRARRSSCHKKLPLIVFSPGNGIPIKGYFYLGNSWAKRGYATIFVNHAGLSENHDKKYWEIRPQDISLVLDQLPQIERSLTDLDGSFDLSRIGVAGHSYGGYTTYAIVGVPMRVSRARTISLRDHRVSAFVVLSAVDPQMVGLDASAWLKSPIPGMTIIGRDETEVRSGGRLIDLIAPKRRELKNRKFLAQIRGADHFSFIDGIMMLEKQPRGEQLKMPDFGSQSLIVQASTLFWDRYLRELPGARPNLSKTGGGLTIYGN